MREVKNSYDNILPLYLSFAAAQNAKTTNQKILDATKGIDAVQSMDVQTKYDKLIDYRSLLAAFQELNARIKMGEAFLARFSQLDGLEKLNGQMTEALEKDRSLHALLQEQKRLNHEKEKLSADLSRFVDDDRRAMDAYLNGLSEAGTCPLCKQPIDDGALHAIKHSLED